MQLKHTHKLVDRELAVMSELVRLGFYQVVSSGRFWLTVIISGTSTQRTLGSITAFCCWVKEQAVRHVRGGACMFECISACVCTPFLRNTHASPRAWILLVISGCTSVSCLFHSSWQRLQASIHSGRRSNCFATACLHTVGRDPSPQQPQALSQLITLAQKIFSRLCLQ